MPSGMATSQAFSSCLQMMRGRGAPWILSLDAFHTCGPRLQSKTASSVAKQSNSMGMQILLNSASAGWKETPQTATRFTTSTAASGSYVS